MEEEVHGAIVEVGGGGWAPYLEQHRREELYTYTYTHIIISLIHAHSTWSCIASHVCVFIY